MANGIQMIRASASITTKWSGGTTTELAIFPKDSEYTRRDFGWRLSTATVEAEHTVFTDLAGMWRILMVTKGQLKLTHQGRHAVSLAPFDQHAFDGGWATESWGQAQDLNLMLSAAYQGMMKTVSWDARHSTVRELLHPAKTPYRHWELLYGISGSLAIEIGTEWGERLYPGDLLMVTGEDITKPTELVATGEAGTIGSAVLVSISGRG